MTPDQPAIKSTWRESVRSLDGIWIVCEGRGEMPDGCAGTTLMTLGYDPARQCFVGAFIGSMMANQWLYEGVLDPDGKRLILNTEGPDFTEPGRTTQYRDVIEIVDADHRVLSSSALGGDGEWHGFMTADYRRVV